VAEALRQIELQDGSIITGTIQSFDGEQYVIQSDSLGVVTLKDSQITAIRSPAGEAHGDTGTVSQDELVQMQQKLLSDQEIMALIQSLQNDPQMQAILNDPQVMQSVMSGDVQSLMDNPKFKALMDNPTVRQISDKVQP
jgi:hypothetical protein